MFPLGDFLAFSSFTWLTASARAGPLGLLRVFILHILAVFAI
jgi:hypothetical protein